MGRIVVVGSCMVDFICYAPRLPTTGETIHGTKLVTGFGGKGANQCVAAAKLGSSTKLVARVGDDHWGKEYIKSLEESHVDVWHVFPTSNYSTGIAQITVSEQGDNQIVIVPGANAALCESDVDAASQDIKESSALICQLETPIQPAIRAMKLCKGISIMNGAPALADCDPRIFTMPDIFCVNESEAEVFTGITINSEVSAEKALENLIQRGCKTVILTLGPDGVLFASKDDSKISKVATPQVKAVNTTGAGDAFIGTLAHLLTARTDMSLYDIVEASCFAAADSVTKPGVQTSFASADLLDEYFKNKK